MTELAALELEHRRLLWSELQDRCILQRLTAEDLRELEPIAAACSAGLGCWMREREQFPTQSLSISRKVGR